ncbi:glycosyltransferase family 4 protein [Synechococcus sp. Tobar12-5m-g]|uniref:glycosyltransferase family 4 protein n=1 Tax=unclassified Synechococcus TaxID=2626047 RepID=UPI0020CF5C33|nr:MULTISPECIES: glycosyltransferase family 4 protein [unclassified Synechococcus]MCP9772253.1 glycosyltransferase family 4 protein [Synechococcus sp. Tobar12-5m-g]MCP9873076.1 glycosyltransferase family 4 protein [Synechococcus sp. Cruz CV-v-12]
MKVLVSSSFFAPDHAGIGVYSTDFPVYLAERGHCVTMVTGFSYYPRWQKSPEDRGRLLATGRYQGVRTLRGYLYVPRKVSTFKRLLHEASFCLFAALNFLRAGRPDVIVIFTPPFFLGFVALLAAKVWCRPLVINIQDLPLDAAVALGMLETGPLSRIMQTLEGWIYRQADQVTTISDGMLVKVWAKGVPSHKTRLVPNWVDVKEYAGAAPSGRFLNQHSAAVNKLTVAYAGNLGVKQGVDSLIRLASAVEHDPRFYFFVIGDGADKPRLSTMADEMQLKNLTFLPFLDQNKYKEMLTDVDLIFVSQRSGAGDNFFPSKLLGLMARQKPLLVAADASSELAQAIVAGRFGLVSPYGDLPGLQQNLETYANDAVFREKTGWRGLEAVKAFDRNTVLGDWESSLEVLVFNHAQKFRI